MNRIIWTGIVAAGIAGWLALVSDAEQTNGPVVQSVLLADDFKDGVSTQWTANDTGHLVFGKDATGRPFLEGASANASLIKASTQWKDYQVTFLLRLKEVPADGTQFFRMLIRTPPLNVWGGYNILFHNAGGKMKIEANVWPTTPNMITPVPVDQNWHKVRVAIQGGELTVQLDDREDARLWVNDIYTASSAFGGVAFGFSDARWQLADLRVSALGATFNAGDVLGRYCQFAYYPSANTLALKVDLTECLDQAWAKDVAAIRFTVQRTGREKVLAQGVVAIASNKVGEAESDLPKLAEGEYEVRFTAAGTALTATKKFVRRYFPWEGNTLGVTKKVYPPFEPMAVNGSDVKVIQRSYRMNGFGLWDRVVTEDRDILAAPIQMKYATAAGSGQWHSVSGKFDQRKAHRVTYQGEACADALTIKSVSSIEVDGCMKVEMDLLPGRTNTPVTKLWLEIPLKDAEVPLFFPQLADCRNNYAGVTPRGGKIVWEPRTTEWMFYPAKTWKAEPGPNDGVIWTPRSCYQRDFAYYVWLGAAERGLAWFGENDRGYITDPAGDTQVISREGDRVVLRVYFINRETVLTKPRHIVFGLQASPTKPMPKDWRRNVAIPIGSGPCMGIGTYMCADKYPADYDFTIVDKVIEARLTGVIDTNFFKMKDQKRSHQPARAHGFELWVDMVLCEAGIAKMYTTPDWIEKQGGMLPKDVQEKALKGPFPSYFEGHVMNVDTPEWDVFQDEWGKDCFTPRQWRKMDTFMAIKGNKNYLCTDVGIVITPSYQNFALWYANEWLKRGVSLYLDNSMLELCGDPHKSAAYRNEKGEIVPAVLLWSQREYYRRMWNLRCYWNEKGVTFPLTITHHVTNTQILPLHTWIDKLTDLEWVPQHPPTDPDFLLTETVSRQIGAYADLVVGPTRGFDKTTVYKDYNMTTNSLVRMEWGLRMVHEISRWAYPYQCYATSEPARSLEKAVWDFGYGLPECRVQNYWADEPVVTITPKVKWLALVRPAEKKLLLVMQSYEPKPVNAVITCNAQTLGFVPRGVVKDAETGKALGPAGATISVPMTEPYHTRVLTLGE